MGKRMIEVMGHVPDDLLDGDVAGEDESSGGNHDDCSVVVIAARSYGGSTDPLTYTLPSTVSAITAVEWAMQFANSLHDDTWNIVVVACPPNGRQPTVVAQHTEVDF